MWTRRHIPPMRNSQRWLAMLVIGLLLLQNAPGQGMVSALALQTSSAPRLRILAQDGEHLLVELVTPPALLDVHHKMDTVAGSSCQTVDIPGYQSDGYGDEPRLPIKSLLIGVPAQAQIEVSVIQQEWVDVVGKFHICPAAGPLPGSATGAPVPQEWQAENNKGLSPQHLADVTVVGQLRDQRVARLSFHPLQYDRVNAQLRLASRLRADVRFLPADAGPDSVRSRPEGEAFEMLLQNLLLNYRQAKPWRTAPPMPPRQIAPVQARSSQVFKILVRTDGMYRLSYTDLVAAGFDPGGINPHHLQIYNRQHQIAIRVEGEDDGSFDPGDAIEFYGQAMDTKYTDTNVYWLTVGDQDGLRMAVRNGTPGDGSPAATHYTATVHVEENHVYWPAVTPPSGQDYWFWTRLVGGDPSASLAIPVTLPAMASGEYTGTLRVVMKSRYDDPVVSPDHHVRIFLNNVLLRDLWWDGEQPITAEATFSQAMTALTDTVRLQVPGDTGAAFDGVYLDWLDISYQHTYQVEDDRLHFGSPGAGTWLYTVDGFRQPGANVYDVTDPLNPQLITGTGQVATAHGYALVFEDRIVAPKAYEAVLADHTPVPQLQQVHDTSWLRDPSNHADEIIITHPDFYTATLPLAAYREQQGLHIVTVTTEDIYDQFGDGIFSAEAIRAFLAYAYAAWQPPAPSFVLLVGDGNLDFRDYLGSGEPNYVPPFMAQVDPFIGETMSDNRYVTVSGHDPLPDMFIGRLPASTAAEASVMIEKTITYEQQSPTDDRPRRVLFVADNADSAGDFAALSNDLIALLPSGYEAQRVYYGITHSTVAATRQAIIEGMARGPLFVNYIGHAAVQYWAGEQLFRIQDIASTVTATLPILLAWSCYEGWFAYPGYPSLDESLMRAADGGVVASWSPTGLGVAWGHNELARRFYDAVFRDNVTRFGQATTLAKLRLYGETSWDHDLIDTYLVFGDPALHMLVDSRPVKIYLPVIINKNQ